MDDFIKIDLKGLLNNYDLTITDLSKLSGIPYQTLYQINNVKSIRISTMNKIISTLGCTIYDYIKIKDEYNYNRGSSNRPISKKGNIYSININDVYEASGLNKKDFSEIIEENMDTTKKLIKGIVKEIKINTVKKLIAEFHCTLEDIFKLEEVL